jgi:predicted metal-dependent hydrolase
MASKARILYEFEGFSIPLQIIKEWRSSVRISIAKTGAFLRLPRVMPAIMVSTEIDKAKKWLQETIKKDPKAFVRFSSQGYADDFTKEVYDETFTIQVTRESRKSNTGKIKPGLLSLKIADDLTPYQEKDVIKKLQSRLFAKYFQGPFSQRVQDINNQTYKKDFKSVNLKYNRSNWGSCSSKSNLNFSTRLLLTPAHVRDYVIVHELAHLTEMNHSDRFWNLVEKAMPGYKDQEKWLKDYGSSCDF